MCDTSTATILFPYLLCSEGTCLFLSVCFLTQVYHRTSRCLHTVVAGTNCSYIIWRANTEWIMETVGQKVSVVFHGMGLQVGDLRAFATSGLHMYNNVQYTWITLPESSVHVLFEMTLILDIFFYLWWEKGSTQVYSVACRREIKGRNVIRKGKKYTILIIAQSKSCSDDNELNRVSCMSAQLLHTVSDSFHTNVVIEKPGRATGDSVV